MEVISTIIQISAERVICDVGKEFVVSRSSGLFTWKYTGTWLMVAVGIAVQLTV